MEAVGDPTRSPHQSGAGQLVWQTALRAPSAHSPFRMEFLATKLVRIEGPVGKPWRLPQL